MSVDAIGTRIAEIQGKMDALLGSPAGPAAPGFDAALAGASGPSASAPVAHAASLGAGSPAGAVDLAAGGGSTPFDGMIQAAASKHGIDPALLKALIRQESNFNPNAVSPAGATGLTQLMPGTAAGLGVGNPRDPGQAIEGGAKYLKQQLDRFGGDPSKALAAYNAGPGAVQKYGGIPPYAETQNYVKKVLAYAEEYRTAAPAAATAVAPTTPATMAAAVNPAALAAALSSPLPSASAPVASSPGQFGIV